MKKIPIQWKAIKIRPSLKQLQDDLTLYRALRRQVTKNIKYLQKQIRKEKAKLKHAKSYSMVWNGEIKLKPHHVNIW